MDAYAKICGEFARAYFMIFYLVILVILTIVVSFILDAFAAIDSEQKQAAGLIVTRVTNPFMVD
jgi:hypothetical protein